MKKTIIVLGGTANTGKSMTLASLGRQLQENGANTNNDLSDNDYRAIFQYRDQIIGVQTFGDFEEAVAQGLSEFLQQECGIIAIASKAYGATVVAIVDFAARNGYRVIWTNPYIIRDDRIDTQRIKEYTASHLHQMINDVITGVMDNTANTNL